MNYKKNAKIMLWSVKNSLVWIILVALNFVCMYVYINTHPLPIPIHVCIYVCAYTHTETHIYTVLRFAKDSLETMLLSEVLLNI